MRKAGYRLERIRPPAGTNAPEPRHLPPPTDEDIRFRIGDWRYTVAATAMVGRPCFGYGPNSWHPFVETARQLLDNPYLDYEGSTLHRLYSTWHPGSIAEAQFPGEVAPPILSQIPANTLFEPWLLPPPPCDDPLNPNCQSAGAPLHGPVSAEDGLKEFERIKTIIESIEQYGYNPGDFPRGLITGILLKHDDQTRFLVTHGQHRTAVLTAMGSKEIEMGIRGDGPSIVDSGEAEEWPHVRSGLVPVETAVSQLARYFRVGGPDDPALVVRGIIERRS